jgi:hypothetical protein
MFRAKKNRGKESDIKEWFIIVNQQQQGPYSLFDLKREPSFTPDTLVWREGFQEWIRARFVPELQEVFKDEPESRPLYGPENKKEVQSDLGQHQATLALNQDPYQFLLWILLLLLTLFYMFYRFYYQF